MELLPYSANMNDFKLRATLSEQVTEGGLTVVRELASAEMSLYLLV